MNNGNKKDKIKMYGFTLTPFQRLLHRLSCSRFPSFSLSARVFAGFFWKCSSKLTSVQ